MSDYLERPIIHQVRRSVAAALRRASEVPEMEWIAMEEEHEAGKSCGAIARSHGVSRSTLKFRLRREGVYRPDERFGSKLNAAQREAAIRDYVENGMTMDRVAEKYGIKDCSVWEMLRTRGLTRPQTEMNRRFTLNEAAFDPPLTDEQAYWIGFLMTDGFVSNKKDGAPTIGITLRSTDAQHLERLRAFLGTDRPVQIIQPKKYAGSYNSSPQARLDVRSWQLAKSLAAYGVVPNKTHVKEASGGVEKRAAFWAGCLDGDGSVFVARQGNRYMPYIALCSAKIQFVEQFAAFCRAIVPSSPAMPRESHHVWQVSFGGMNSVPLIRTFYCREGPSLDRKQQAAQQILKMAETGAWKPLYK